jgi:hypothetical protein
MIWNGILGGVLCTPFLRTTIRMGKDAGSPPIELIIMLASWVGRKNKNLEGTKMKVGLDG